MKNQKDKLSLRVMVLERALKEIVCIAEISEGQAALFYGMLARKALEKEEKCQINKKNN